MSGVSEAPAEVSYVTVKDWLWHAAMREMDPAPSPDKPYYKIQPQAAAEYPRALVQAVVDYLCEDLTCDHAVNICMCGTASVVSELLLNLAGEETCAACSGDGRVWDQAQYEAAKVQYLDEWKGEMWWDINDDGYIVCSACSGRGTVNQDDCV